jgi:hypothetical protein
MPVIGFLHGASPSYLRQFVDALREGLGEAGYLEGRNLAIEYRWAEGHYDRLAALAADLVDRQVAVIMALGAPTPIPRGPPRPRHRPFRSCSSAPRIRSRPGWSPASIAPAAISPA